MGTGRNVSPGLRLDLELGSRSSLHIAGRYTKIDGENMGFHARVLTPKSRTDS